jgi:phosphonate transport system ATP-binding protein
LKFDFTNIFLEFSEVLALDDINLSILGGECLVLLGSSGSGKSSFLNLINRSIVPSRGKVVVDGENIAGFKNSTLQKYRQKIAYIPQQLHLIPNVKVLHNVLLGRLAEFGFLRSCKEFIFPSSQLLDEIYLLLKQLGIEEKMFSSTSQLSGGEQQRVAIARALFQNPQVIVADEPISSIDPNRGREVLFLLKTVAKERDLTLILSLHNPELAIEFFPRVIGLKHGKIIFDSPSEQVDVQRLKELYAI